MSHMEANRFEPLRPTCCTGILGFSQTEQRNCDVQRSKEALID